MKEEIKDKVFFIPTTIFVDKNGNVVSDIIESAKSKSEYVNVIEKILAGDIDVEISKDKHSIGGKCDINGKCDK